MRTVVLKERPTELEAWLEQRRTLGQDRFDEVWESEPLNIGGPDDYRVPDQA